MNQNLIEEQVKRGQNFGNACCNSAHNLLSSCQLSKDIKVIIYKTIILPVDLYTVLTENLPLCANSSSKS
jgi:hypothetical protein